MNHLSLRFQLQKKRKMSMLKFQRFVEGTSQKRTSLLQCPQQTLLQRKTEARLNNTIMGSLPLFPKQKKQVQTRYTTSLSQGRLKPLYSHQSKAIPTLFISSVFPNARLLISKSPIQVNPQILIIEKKNMEEQSLSAPLFLPLNQSKAHTLRNQQIIFQAFCSLHPQAWTNHSLTLVNNILLLETTNSLPLFLEITFDAKFEILYQTETNVHSMKLGIRFYDEDERGLRVFMQPSTLQQWLSLLRKKMNQKGFHEMFKPTRKLGKGNFATVYEAERLTDHQKFAVKAFIKQNYFSAKNGKQSLINELGILRQLNTQPNNNILKIEGVYESDNSIYVVMELLDGKTLYHAIEERNGRFSRQEVRGIMAGLLRGVRHMHGKRIMHRDLKPQNIMLRGDSLEPVIVDFGLATFADLNEYLFFRCGTPGYVAPQILKLTEFQHIEPICDMFSLGSIFHLLLCRKALFAGSKYEEVCRNNKQCNFTLDGDRFVEISNFSRQLLQRMLVIDPKGRINPSEALNHGYFSEQDTEEQLDFKISSPVLTDISNYKEPTIKRMGLLFY